jgi:hypothetical protein
MLVLLISIVIAAAIALEIRRTIIKWRAVEKDGWIQMILKLYSCEDPTAQIIVHTYSLSLAYIYIHTHKVEHSLDYFSPGEA